MTTRDDRLPPIIDYVLSRRCPACGAAAWTDCDAPRKQAQPAGKPRTHLQHARRVDAGIWHQRADRVRMPWPEDCALGGDYSTIDFTARPAEGEQ